MANGPLASWYLRRAARAFRIDNGLFFRPGESGSSLAELKKTGAIVDFCESRYIHFGDLLFFIPLLLILAEHAPLRCIAPGVYREFLSFLLADTAKLSIHSPGDAPPMPDLCPVITSPYVIGLAPDRWRGHPLVGIGLAEEPVRGRYPEYLARIFLNFAGIETHPEEIQERIRVWCHAIREKTQSLSREFDAPLKTNTLWVAPYMGSGRFRDLLGRKKSAILLRAQSLAQQSGASILLAGGKTDPPVTFGGLDFIDNRRATITDALCLAASPKVVSGVGFDGFWMHFFDILGKPYEVLFRGRYTKALRQLHYQSVNLSFCYFTERTYFSSNNA
jgi:hypothetical protein